MSESSREAFEKLAKRKVWIERNPCGHYVNVIAQAMWEAWQAAYAAGVKAERERCAKVCEQYAEPTIPGAARSQDALICASAIRKPPSSDDGHYLWTTVRGDDGVWRKT